MSNCNEQCLVTQNITVYLEMWLKIIRLLSVKHNWFSKRRNIYCKDTPQLFLRLIYLVE